MPQLARFVPASSNEARLAAADPTDSILSIGSGGSILSIGSAGSILSIGSAGSILSIGSAGSILSIGSAGSILSIGSAGSILSIGSAMSVNSIGGWATNGRGDRRDDGQGAANAGPQLVSRGATLLALAALGAAVLGEVRGLRR